MKTLLEIREWLDGIADRFILTDLDTTLENADDDMKLEDDWNDGMFNQKDFIRDIHDFTPDCSKLGNHRQLMLDLEYFNRDFHTDIKVTNTFRFAPGYLKQVRELMMLIAFPHTSKKNAPLHRLLQYNKWSLDRFKIDLVSIRDRLTKLRRTGLTMKNALDSGEEVWAEFVKRLTANEYFDDLFISKYIKSKKRWSVGWRYFRQNAERIVLVKRLSNINLIIGTPGDTLDDSGIKALGNVPFGDVELIFSYNAIEWTNNMNAKQPFLGGERSIGCHVNIYPYYKGLYHPYVQAPGRTGYSIGNVCFGDMYNEIVNALHTMNWTALDAYLAQWSTLFLYGRSTPLNNLHNSHVGYLPSYDVPETEGFFSKVHSEISHTCERVLEQHYMSNVDQMNEDFCSSCLMQSKCNLYSETISQVTIPNQWALEFTEIAETAAIAFDLDTIDALYLMNDLIYRGDRWFLNSRLQGIDSQEVMAANAETVFRFFTLVNEWWEITEGKSSHYSWTNPSRVKISDAVTLQGFLREILNADYSITGMACDLEIKVARERAYKIEYQRQMQSILEAQIDTLEQEIHEQTERESIDSFATRENL